MENNLMNTRFLAYLLGHMLLGVFWIYWCNFYFKARSKIRSDTLRSIFYIVQLLLFPLSFLVVICLSKLQEQWMPPRALYRSVLFILEMFCWTGAILVFSVLAYLTAKKHPPKIPDPLYYHYDPKNIRIALIVLSAFIVLLAIINLVALENPS